MRHVTEAGHSARAMGAAPPDGRRPLLGAVSIVVTTAKPSWIRTYSTWQLSSFTATTGKLISCSTLKQVANNYLSTGEASGYAVLVFKGPKGRRPCPSR